MAYTSTMQYSIALLCLLTLSQITSGTSIPEDAQIFTITLKEGQSERVVNAAVKVDGQFIDEFDRANPPARVELYLDTPWAPSPPKQELGQRILEIATETNVLRKQRYEKSGYEQVPLPDGKGSTWVSKETLARQERGAALRAALVADQEALLAAHAPEPSVGESSTGGPGFARLWGRHIMVLVSALVLLVVTIKACF